MKFPVDERGITIHVLGLGPNTPVRICQDRKTFGPFEKDMIVILCPTVDCRVEIGPKAKATGESTRIPANMWLPTKILTTHKLSVLWDGTDEGVLNVTEAT